MFRILFFSTAALFAADSASADDLRIRYGDLDLATATGAAALDARIARAAQSYCAPYIGVRKPECRQAVRAEVLRSLPDDARTDYARGRRSFDI